MHAPEKLAQLSQRDTGCLYSGVAQLLSTRTSYWWALAVSPSGGSGSKSPPRVMRSLSDRNTIRVKRGERPDRPAGRRCVSPGVRGPKSRARGEGSTRGGPPETGALAGPCLLPSPLQPCSCSTGCSSFGVLFCCFCFLNPPVGILFHI